ncbi:iron complex transport system ATP-binding protein [Nakamurella sp. UYEF19]|uniref:ABC transporter ATP-binding protein n=1 Tax=Nakamurella sp. UYEF19 TaxID=1756392 RepID=UPI00339AB3BC
MGLTVGYQSRDIIAGLDVQVPTGLVTAIVGANACGKSTLLRALARLLKPRAGTVLLDGHDLHRLPSGEVAKVLGLLPQSPVAPEGITVSDLVSRGRYPRQGWVRRRSSTDDEAVAAALIATDTLDLADEHLDELSGGQRQRVWIAMALAQETDILLLDEPTTFLDLAHQIEVLDLLCELNRNRGTTVVLVLHELNQAARFADHLIAMKDGRIVAQGPASEVITQEVVEDVFGLRAHVGLDPVSGTPMVVPVSRHLSTARPRMTDAELPIAGR